MEPLGKINRDAIPKPHGQIGAIPISVFDEVQSTNCRAQALAFRCAALAVRLLGDHADWKDTTVGPGQDGLFGFIAGDLHRTNDIISHGDAALDRIEIALPPL